MNKKKKRPVHLFFACLAVLLMFFAGQGEARADAVKPALIEVTADVTGKTRIEVRASIEALLSGINARYDIKHNFNAMLLESGITKLN
jgi:hypothetical protein